MAALDHYICDVCGAKCFYDANVNWEAYRAMKMLGEMAVICGKCARTHVVKILPRRPKGDPIPAHLTTRKETKE